MTTVKTEIAQAIKTLNLQETDICLVPDVKKTYLELLAFFVKSGDRRWWWEDFKQESFRFIDYEHPYEQIRTIIPEDTHTVWFMVEDDQEEYYPIYNCSPAIISDVIGECSAFEYYVIDNNKQWLLCENHSGQLIGVGKKLKEINKNILRISDI